MKVIEIYAQLGWRFGTFEIIARAISPTFADWLYCRLYGDPELSDIGAAINRLEMA